MATKKNAVQSRQINELNKKLDHLTERNNELFRAINDKNDQIEKMSFHLSSLQRRNEQLTSANNAQGLRLQMFDDLKLLLHTTAGQKNYDNAPDKNLVEANG